VGPGLSLGRSGKTIEHVSTLPVDGIDPNARGLTCRSQPAQARAERGGLIGQELRQARKQASKSSGG